MIKEKYTLASKALFVNLNYFFPKKDQLVQSASGKTVTGKLISKLVTFNFYFAVSFWELLKNESLKLLKTQTRKYGNLDHSLFAGKT